MEKEYVMYSLQHAEECAEFFGPQFDRVVNVFSLQDMRDCNEYSVVLFGGGEDVSPAMYGECCTKYTRHCIRPSDRDTFESQVFQLSRSRGAKNLGICRGAQFLCVMSGGTLFQHVTNHSRDHELFFPTTKNCIITNSVHHQMMNIKKIKNHVKIIAHAWNTGSSHLDYETKNMIPSSSSLLDELEIAYFEDTQSLAIQGHPEYSEAPGGFQKTCRDLVKEYILK